MPFLNIFKYFSPKPHQQKQVEKRGDSRARAHRNYTIHEEVLVNDANFELETRHPQRWHTAESLLEYHESTTNEDQINIFAKKSARYSTPSETSRSWSPIPSVRRYPGGINSVSGSSKTSLESRGRRQHVFDGGNETYIRDFEARDAYKYYPRSQGVPNKVKSDDGWYLEEMDRREWFRNPDIHTTTTKEKTNEKKTGSFKGIEGRLFIPEISGPTIYQHEVWNAGESEPELYHYIVPGGMNVIFKDEAGNEVSRVGHFGESAKRSRKVSPTIIQDEHGDELYRTGDFGPKPKNKENKDYERVVIQKESHSNSSQTLPRVPTKAGSNISYASVPRDAMNIILIDDHGYQVSIRSAGRNVSSQTPSYGSKARS